MKQIIRNIRKVMRSQLSIMYYALFIGIVFASCADNEDPFFTVSENDSPRILNTDIPEGSDGEPEVLMTIERTQNFSFSVIVTPVSYTTVTWFIDGQQVAEGLSIDTQLLAGDHILRIVATTTKGLQTERTCKLVVRPAATDPAPANKQKERLVKPGTQVTLHGTNMANVVKVCIGDRAINCTYNREGYVEYTVPADMAEGTYPLTVVDASGNVYGAGTITLSLNPVYTPEENILWEGEFSVTWGTPFDGLKTTAINLVKAGTILRVYVEGNGQGSVTTAWWNNILTGLGDPNRGDIKISGKQTLEYVLTDLSMELLAQQDGMLIVGDGYTILRVTAE